jgi:hypothetical protein
MTRLANVLWSLTASCAGTQGAKWWKDTCLRTVVQAAHEAGIDAELLARRILTVEFLPYYSQKWAPPPVTLLSQWYGFGLVKRAVERGATIVATRGGNDWTVAVPELRDYPRFVRTKNPRRAIVSPRNIDDGGWPLVLEAIGLER